MNSIRQRLSLSSRQVWIFGALAMAMAATRFHHEGTAFALPDASLAVFFLAGAFLSTSGVFIGLLALAGIIDYLAVTSLGVSDYCFSPAYAFMAPTYAAMWVGGIWLGRLPGQQSRRSFALSLTMALAVSTCVAFLISNGSFYWLSGKVSGTAFVDYALGLEKEFPAYLGATILYVLAGLGIGAGVRILENDRARAGKLESR